MILPVLAAALSAWALVGETDPAVGRAGLVALGAIAAAGLPRARASARLAVAVTAAPLALALRLDSALGRPPLGCALAGGAAILLVALSALGARRGGPGYAWAWLVLVLALPGLVLASGMAGCAVPAPLRGAAALSPLGWAARLAAGEAAGAGVTAGVPWGALALVGALAALPRARSRPGPRASAEAPR